MDTAYHNYSAENIPAKYQDYAMNQTTTVTKNPILQDYIDRLRR